MNRSPYLTQALQGMGAPMAAQPQGPDLGAMAAAVRGRKEWQAANPGQNYLQHKAMGAMDALKGAPQALMNAPGALGGLFSLGGR